MESTLALKNLIAQVGPNTLGIVWATEKNLNDFPPYFVELDYLLDGQLKKQINQIEQESFSSGPALFVNQHFLGNLYVLVLKTNPEKKISDLLNENKNTFQIMKKSNPSATNLIFISGDKQISKNEITAQLKKMIPEGTHLVM